MASSLARFRLSTLSSVCCQDGKPPGTPNALTFGNLHAAPTPWGPRDWNSEARCRRWGLNEEKKVVLPDGVVWFKIEV